MIARLFQRPPDLVIGIDYLARWYLIPRNRFFNIYLHRFDGSDDDRALHDHPWISVSVMLTGELIEHDLSGRHHVPWLLPVFRRARYAHRLELVRGPAFTVFITGPRLRLWGFLCPQGWRPWHEFTTVDGSRVGRGCDD